MKPPSSSKRSGKPRKRSNLNWIRYLRPYLKSGAGVYPEYKKLGVTAIILAEAKCRCRDRDGKRAAYVFIPESWYIETDSNGTKRKVKTPDGWYCPICGKGHDRSENYIKR